MKQFAIFFFSILAASVSLSAQTVSNVAASQEGNNIVVSYDIDKASPEVQLTVSTNGGRTFSSPLKKVSGDVADVQPGRRRIVWDVLAEVDKLSGDDIVFYVVAESRPEYINGHEVVDLGLSVKWATCNVGATKPEEYGDYFAWGETSPKNDYDGWETLKYRIGGDSDKNIKFSKYVASSKYGPIDNKTVLEPMDDAAHVNWGGSWRMPTDAEWKELRNNCRWKRTKQNGVLGYMVTSKKTGHKGKSIFLPAAGYCCRWKGFFENYIGYYWSSSLSAIGSNYAYGELCYCDLWNSFSRENRERYLGFTIRPVSE